MAPAHTLVALLAAFAGMVSAQDPRGAAAPRGHLRALPADVQQALSEVLGVGFRLDGGRVLAARASLEPMWQTMAQDSNGRVDQRAMRYMVHRHFLQRYHISIIGMESLQVSSSATAAEVAVLAELTPGFVRSLLEGASSSEAGFSLQDTAALVAVIERLVEDSGHDVLQAAYGARGVEITDMLTRDQLMDVLKHFTVRWVSSHLESVAELEANIETVMQMPFWQDWLALVTGRVHAFEHWRTEVPASGSKPSWNPMRPLFSFADAQAAVSGLAWELGRTFEPQCESLAEVLHGHGGRGTGRVPLSTFYSAVRHGRWRFVESPEYLRRLGVLEEGSLFREPQVLTANYIQSANSCVVTKKHFRVCCSSPCQDIYSDIEAAVGAPEAEPEALLAVVSNITYGLDDSAAKLTKKARSQLREIAQANHGKVPLHGLLFAQWLHFVFPMECPFPHKSGSMSGLSPSEFDVQGDSHLATVEEMKAAIEQGKKMADTSRREVAGAEGQQEGEVDDDDSAHFADKWRHEEEELLSQHLHPRPRTSSLRTTLRAALSFIATASVLFIAALRPLLEAQRTAAAGGLLPGGLAGRSKSHIV